jgi:hypothetical protein
MIARIARRGTAQEAPTAPETLLLLLLLLLETPVAWEALLMLRRPLRFYSRLLLLLLDAPVADKVMLLPPLRFFLKLRRLHGGGEAEWSASTSADTNFSSCARITRQGWQE